MLLDEVLRYLPADPNGSYVDGTLGGGGHARAVAERLGPDGLLVGVDRDPDALDACRSLAEDFRGRVRLAQASFGALGAVLEAERLGPVDGILLDLGVSSRQLDSGEKGFSFLRDGPLDMRMDPLSHPSAAELVNEWPAEELEAVFRDLGEEPRAARVARAVEAARRRKPLATTGELARVVERALGRRGGKHPATKVFQALRIAVNDEMTALDCFLRDVTHLLKPGGRVVVISYHSLEDRRVKLSFREGEARAASGDVGLHILTRKAVRPQRAEAVRNPRARSAKLRAAERVPLNLPPQDASQGGHP